jgi:prevent-host-death family protein
LTNLTNIDSLRNESTEARMGKPVNIYDAKTRLSELVDRAQAGEEIVIAKAGRPVARLVPLRAVREARAPGRWNGRVKIAPDFDAPLSTELLDEFESGN